MYVVHVEEEEEEEEEEPKLNGMVGCSNPDREIVSQLDKKIARWSSVSYVPKKI
jgi:hypothetical protein